MATVLAITETNYVLFSEIIPDYVTEIARTEEDVIAFGIVFAKVPVGSIVVRLDGETAELLWYYIDPKFRRMRIGRESLFELCWILLEQYNVKRIEAVIPADAGEGLDKLFGIYDAEIETMPECRFDTTLGEFLNAKKIKGNPAKCVSLEKTSGSLLRMLCNKIVEQGIDLVEMPIRQEDYYAKACAIHFDKDVPDGMLLISKTEEAVSIPFLVSFAEDPRAIMDMLAFARDEMKDLEPTLPLYMNLVDENLIGAVRIIAGKAKDDDTGFRYNEKVTLYLDFLDDIRERTRSFFDAWEKAKEGKGDVKIEFDENLKIRY